MEGLAPRVGVIAGLRLEVAGFGESKSESFIAFASGGSASAARLQIAKWIGGRTITHLLSFGLAGGLAPEAAPGALIVARRVFDGHREYLADPVWRDLLLRLLPDASLGDFEGVDLPVTSPDSKRSLYQRRFALACDMESHAVAAAATRAGIPFAAVRAVADSVERAIPAAALAGLGADGTTKPLAVVRALLAQPQELPALLRVARDSRRGLEALKAAAPRIAAAFACPAARPEEASDDLAFGERI